MRSRIIPLFLGGLLIWHNECRPAPITIDRESSGLISNTGRILVDPDVDFLGRNDRRADGRLFLAFFVFDLSDVVAPVDSASFEVVIDTYFGSSPSEEIVLNGFNGDALGLVPKGVFGSAGTAKVEGRANLTGSDRTMQPPPSSLAGKPAVVFAPTRRRGVGLFDDLTSGVEYSRRTVMPSDARVILPAATGEGPPAIPTGRGETRVQLPLGAEALEKLNSARGDLFIFGLRLDDPEDSVNSDIEGLRFDAASLASDPRHGAGRLIVNTAAVASVPEPAEVVFFLVGGVAIGFLLLARRSALVSG